MSVRILEAIGIALVPTFLLVLAWCFVKLLPAAIPQRGIEAQPTLPPTPEPEAELPLSVQERAAIRKNAEHAAQEQMRRGTPAVNPFAGRHMRALLWQIELEAALAAAEWRFHG